MMIRESPNSTLIYAKVDFYLRLVILERNQAIGIIVAAIIIGSLGIVVVWNLPPEP